MGESIILYFIYRPDRFYCEIDSLKKQKKTRVERRESPSMQSYFSFFIFLMVSQRTKKGTKSQEENYKYKVKDINNS